MGLPCEDLDIWLERFHDGDLRSGELRSARSHVATCPRCQERLRAIRDVGATLHSTLEDAAPPVPGGDFVRALAGKLGDRPPTPLGVPFDRTRAWIAAAIVAGLLVVLASRDEPGPTAPQADLATVEVLTPGVDVAVRVESDGDSAWQVVWVGAEETPR